MVKTGFAFEQQHFLKRMKLFSTGLLLGMSFLYVISRYYRDIHVVFEWMVAFSEVAMVGALADWFAVVALFRYPLTIPIPHPAIIQKNMRRRPVIEICVGKDLQWIRVDGTIVGGLVGLGIYIFSDYLLKLS